MEYTHWPLSKHLLGFLLVLSFFYNSITEVRCSIHEYNNKGFIQISNAFFFYGGSEGLSTLEDCDGSYIRFENISFFRTIESTTKANRTQQNTTGLVEAIIFDVKDKERIGGFYLNSSAICCSADLAEKGLCMHGEVIIEEKQDESEQPKRFKIFFEEINEEAKMDDITLSINSTGMYYLYFLICDPGLNSTLIRGRTTWRNIGGYLPAKIAPLMGFCGITFLGYVVLSLFWLFRLLRYWKDTVSLHYCITVVITLGMCEMGLWYVEYTHFNSTGRRPVWITLFVVSVTSIEKTLSRLLLLIVCRGFGVVRPYSGCITRRLLSLGVAYLFASEMYGVDENLGTIDDYLGSESPFLNFPVTFLDASFIVWIFLSLSSTFYELQIRRDMVKVELYRKLANSLAVYTLLSITWIGLQIFFDSIDPRDEPWQIYWILPAFWIFLAYLLLVVICILWAPSHNPRRYAYLGETDGSTEEGIALGTITSQDDQQG